MAVKHYSADNVPTLPMELPDKHPRRLRAMEFGGGRPALEDQAGLDLRTESVARDSKTWI